MENLVNSVLPSRVVNTVVENGNNVSTTLLFTTPTTNNNTAANITTTPTNITPNTIIILTNSKDKGKTKCFRKMKGSSVVNIVQK